MNGVKATARIRVEQKVNLVLKNPKLEILGLAPHDEVLITRDPRNKHYKANEQRIILKDSLLFRKCLEETGSVKYCQILIPKQTYIEGLQSLHGEFGKHPGVTNTKVAYEEKNCYPKMTQLIKKWVMLCEQCIRELRTDRSLTRPPLKYHNEHIFAPEDAMQINLVQGLLSSGVCENIVTARDVFYRLLFAYLTAN